MGAIDGYYESSKKRPSELYYENKEYLTRVIMSQLGITEEDLEKDSSWIRAKVRESKIDKLLDKK